MIYDISTVKVHPHGLLRKVKYLKRSLLSVIRTFILGRYNAPVLHHSENYSVNFVILENFIKNSAYTPSECDRILEGMIKNALCCYFLSFLLKLFCFICTWYKQLSVPK